VEARDIKGFRGYADNEADKSFRGNTKISEEGGKMTPEQRKALIRAAFWQARKDGMSYRQARGLARRAIRAYEREGLRCHKTKD